MPRTRLRRGRGCDRRRSVCFGSVRRRRRRRSSLFHSKNASDKYVPLVADAEGVADGERLTLDLGVGLDLGVAFALPRRSRLTRASGFAGRAVVFQLTMRAGVAGRAATFPLTMRAGVAGPAVVFPLAMRAPLLSRHRLARARATGARARKSVVASKRSACRGFFLGDVSSPPRKSYPKTP